MTAPRFGAAGRIALIRMAAIFICEIKGLTIVIVSEPACVVVQNDSYGRVSTGYRIFACVITAR
jgi:hypothetical protein